MKSVLIISAPFGYGPSSKALILAEHLRQRYRVSIISSDSAADFLLENAPRGVDIVRGLFRQNYPSRKSLSEFDAFISINQVPALQHLWDHGIIRRSIFVDSIAQWRLKSGEDDVPKGLLAHIIQDEFSEVASDRWIPKGAFVTAPLIWPDKGCVTLDGRTGVLIHTGGMTSPAAADNLVRAFASEVVVPIVKSIASLGYEVVLLGNSSVLGRLSVDSRVKVLGNVSPASAMRAIAKANVLITTPGKGAIYEAMSTRTPIILLPPINSTQLQHYRVMTNRGIAGLLGSRARDQLLDQMISLHWKNQTNAVLQILIKNSENILQMAENTFSRLFSPDGRFANLDEYLLRIDALRSSLSQLSPVKVIDAALDRLA